MAQKNAAWTVRGGLVFTPAPFGIMGIVNVTPDSFYDGGQYAAQQAALSRIRRCLEEGAHIIDLGAESSRPGSDPVSAAEECRRLAPVLEGLTGLLKAEPAPASPRTKPDAFTASNTGTKPEPVMASDADMAPDASVKPAAFTQPAPFTQAGAFTVSAQTAPSLAEQASTAAPHATFPFCPSGIPTVGTSLPLLSVDTYHAATARAALDAGVHIINDISACTFDPALLDVLSSYKPGYVLMHSQGMPKTMQQSPQYSNVLDEVRFFFAAKLHMLTRAGLPEEHIVLDVGIGFGKSLEHNLKIMKHIEIFKEFGRPLLMGLSMKSFFRDALGLEDPASRGGATQVSTALLAARGVVLHRVHDVAATVQSLRLVCQMQHC